MDNANKKIKKLLKKMTKDELIFLIEILEGIDELHGNHNIKNKYKKVIYIIGSIILAAVTFQFLPKMQSELENKIFHWMK